MYELLDIWVPNLQVVNHNYGSQHIGIRGIINDRDTTYLLIVNGKILNHRSKIGATTELDFPMLSGIKDITVIRGAGSAVYGPGAIAGVIDIRTFDGETLENNELVFRKGIEENFQSYELKYKKDLAGTKRNLMVSYGFSDYKGSSSDVSPYYVSSNTQVNGIDYQQAGKEVPYDIPNDKENSSGQNKHKLHLQLNGENYSAWFRFSQGGYQSVNEKGGDNNEFTRGNRRHKHNQYQQYTLFFEHSLDAPLNGEFTYNLSAQITEAGRLDDATSGDVYSTTESTSNFARRSQFSREDELLLRAVYSFDSKGFKHVYGIETTKDTFGKKGFTDSDIISSSSGVYPDGTFHNQNDVYTKGQWDISTYAAFSELQWGLSDKWTAFAGIRLDKHDYTDWFLSPRAALVYKPNSEHILKIIANQSIKRASEIDMRIAYLENEKAVEEKINSIEFTHNAVNSNGINYKSSVFIQEVEFWSFNQEENKPVGTIGIVGAELELSYSLNQHDFSLNHSFTKLAGVSDSSNNQYITAEPYGYGDDLNTWSNNLTKLVYTWTVDDTWALTSSLRAYWGFDGAEDYGNYNNEQGSSSAQQRFGYDDDGEAFKGNYYLNFGAHMKLSEKLNLRVNAYNVLGWSDKKYNKRNYLKRFGDYRAEAAALALNIHYEF
jgi:iron complex outermembrane receptor protein